MKFDGTVSLGNALSIATVIVGLSIGYAKLQAQQEDSHRRISVIEAAANAREGRIRAAEIALAGQSSDLRNIQNGIDDIKKSLTQLTNGRSDR
ncbi:hypothetical protein [Pseudooceanicola algae]|uniref:Uncharacterized protein n=1 Tax=Pseudooceanicola algae TaxID=1537215 RepID=A0A418SK50_9RHOB|nr:hypothetical protein [Pseudooceanicola algae]QPM89164.1 hypothetical protein PSAL_003750 [Pseudooceanicola algae]